MTSRSGSSGNGWSRAEERRPRPSPGGGNFCKPWEKEGGRKRWRKQPFGSHVGIRAPGSRWGLGSGGSMVAVCQATRGLWTGHPIKWLICLLTDQGSFRAGPHGLSSAQAWRAVGPPWPATSVNGAGIHPNVPAKHLGITPSPVSLTPTSKPSVSSCLQQSGARSRSAPLLQLAASAVTTSTPGGGTNTQP